MTAYYNDIDTYTAQLLRNLIAAGHIAAGDVDERSIEDVRPDDLRGYTQCHFFAGLGGWSHALRLAGWYDSRPVWTGSCPCQPFSSAGKQRGTADKRHLWPIWFNLIRECRPDVVFGEQVEAAVGHGWLDLVQSDLEGEGYACGAVGLPACGVGAPHIRQRLWFVAEALDNPASPRHPRALGETEGNPRHQARLRVSSERGEAGELADSDSERLHGEQIQLLARRSQQASYEAAGNGGAGALANANDTRPQGRELHAQRAGECVAWPDGLASDGLPGPTNGRWGAADWLYCRDGKWRPVEPSTFPLAHGVSARVGRLRAYGNAIVPQVAAEIIKAYMESRP